MDAVCLENNKRVVSIIAWMDEDLYTNAADAWSCVQYLRGNLCRLDMNAACKQLGNDWIAVLQGSGRHTVDDWRCQSGNYIGDVILQKVCGRAHDGTWTDFVVPRFNYCDPYSITCWR